MNAATLDRCDECQLLRSPSGPGHPVGCCAERVTQPDRQWFAQETRHAARTVTCATDACPNVSRARTRPAGRAAPLHECCGNPRTALTRECFPGQSGSKSGANGIRSSGPHLFRLTWSPLVKPHLTRGIVRPLATCSSVLESADICHIGLLCCPYVARREAQG